MYLCQSENQSPKHCLKIMSKIVLMFLLLYLKRGESADSLIQINFDIDKSYLSSNLLTNKNEVSFGNLLTGSNLTDRLIDLSGCLRIRLDSASQQVKLCRLTTQVWQTTAQESLISMDGKKYFSEKKYILGTKEHSLLSIPQIIKWVTELRIQ